MRARLLVLFVTFLVFAAGRTAPQAKAGTIRGRVHLIGDLPGNAIIRMGTDPKCNQANAGKRVVQETVAADIKGNLANVFVRVQGTFPASPAPAEPVTIDQRGCVYVPRVVGVRVGQTVRIRNGDALSHNVHSVAIHNKTFNINQAQAGVIYEFKPSQEEAMLRLRCDIHNWMTAYIGVVAHPYFAVSNSTGAFEIQGVPSGTYTIDAWHERYGRLSKTVSVKAGAAASVEFAYSGSDNSSKKR